jgi:hypothetical protein
MKVKKDNGKTKIAFSLLGILWGSIGTPALAEGNCFLFVFYMIVFLILWVSLSYAIDEEQNEK